MTYSLLAILTTSLSPLNPPPSPKGSLLGNWQWRSGADLSCHHEGDTLVWEVALLLPWQREYRYKYALV
jgi:hypothetical protein